MPLTMAQIGKQLSVTKINGGKEVRKRLIDMGLVPGTKFSVIKNNCNGPIIINLLDIRIAIGRGLAHKICVEEK